MSDTFRPKLINRTAKPFPSVSIGDSIDWKEPPPEEITERVLNSTKSGSILLFHNDLENTTEALPDILTSLRDKGYEFVTVSDLIYWEDYSIDSNGMQIPVSKSSLDITPENVEEVMAQYKDDIVASGVPMEQVLQAVEAIKAGKDIPEEILAVMADLNTKADSNSKQTTENDIITTK